jgi:hypothetical protein
MIRCDSSAFCTLKPQPPSHPRPKDSQTLQLSLDVSWKLLRALNLSRFGRVAADVGEQSKKIDAAGNFIDIETVLLTY